MGTARVGVPTCAAVTATDPADPRRPVAPLERTPSLAGVVRRRTTTVEMRRPEGLDATAVVEGWARDVRVLDGATVVAGRATLRVVTPSLEDPTIREVTAEPRPAAIEALIGAGASGGFRARLADALADEPEGSLLWRLCTEVPNLYVIGGFARQHARTPLGKRARLMVQQAGVCSGWRADGTLMRGLLEAEMVPVVVGPVAPPVTRADDPAGWHEEGPMAALTVRRRRRIDLLAGGRRADVWFRDTFQPVEGEEMVIHEYTLGVSLTAGDSPAVEAIEVTAHVLPWGDCPDAAASPQRMVGLGLREVAARARRDLHGDTTCTHLNACVSSLSDLAVLLDADRGGTPAYRSAR